MSKRFWTGIGMGLALMLFWGASSAQAVTYTLDSTIHMDDENGNVLDIVPVFDDTGATTCLSGACAGPDYLIFEVSVVSGTFDEISGGVIVAFPQDVGYYDGSDTAPSSGSIVVGSSGQFDFDTLFLTGDSVRLFISFAALVGDEQVSFSASPTTHVLFNSTTGIISPIPEPDTGALLALGLVAFGMGRRKRASSV